MNSNESLQPLSDSVGLLWSEHDDVCCSTLRVTSTHLLEELFFFFRLKTLSTETNKQLDKQFIWATSRNATDEKITRISRVNCLFALQRWEGTHVSVFWLLVAQFRCYLHCAHNDVYWPALSERVWIKVKPWQTNIDEIVEMRESRRFRLESAATNKSKISITKYRRIMAISIRVRHAIERKQFTSVRLTDLSDGSVHISRRRKNISWVMVDCTCHVIFIHISFLCNNLVGGLQSHANDTLVPI